MDDLISRQAALEMLNDNELERQADDVFDGDLHRYKRAAQRIIAQLPTIDHVKRGEWIFENRTWFHQPLLKCSCCGRRQFVARFDYCPACGARMETDE